MNGLQRWIQTINDLKKLPSPDNHGTEAHDGAGVSADRP
jgi:hypothetical protein